MEDVFSVAYQQTEDEKDLEYAFFGIFDGHGGREAAVFAKEHLMDFIVRQRGFWAEDDDDSVLKAIHEGFMQTHQAMWKELESWPRTASGLPSTAGTTASVAFIRRGKIYVGHVGDSAIVLGEQDPKAPDHWRCEPLTTDHKPESIEECKRIQESGGKVVCKSGVPRVVWNRPKMGHKGPVRRSTHIDEIPFLAVARSLGDLWSYNSEENVFVVSPEPDTFVYPIDITKHRCLVLGTDGAWNMLNPLQAVRIVCETEKSNEQHMLNPTPGKVWINPSKRLVDKAIEKWTGNNLRADNTSVVTVMLDPPGPPRSEVLKRQRELAANPQPQLPNRGSVALVTNTTADEQPQQQQQQQPAKVPNSQNDKSISIISRFPNSRNREDAQGHSLATSASSSSSSASSSSSSSSSAKLLHDFVPRYPPKRNASVKDLPRLSSATSVVDKSSADSTSGKSDEAAECSETNDNDIQCNEISSSEDETSPSSSGGGRSHRKQRPKGILKASSRLSRELLNLRLQSPAKGKNKKAATKSTTTMTPLRRGRSRTESDTENEDSVANRPLRRQLRYVFKGSKLQWTPLNSSPVNRATF